MGEDGVSAVDASSPSYIPLHLHSAASPGWGVRPVEELCAAAKAMGFSSLALTDRNGLYAVPRFLAAARAHGLAPLVGAEAVAGGHRAVLLARDDAGWASLCRLLSALHCDSGFLLPEALLAHREGLAVISDDPAVLAPLARARLTRACDLLAHAGERVTLAGWWVTAKPVWTRNDEPMEFVTFEDTTALFDATFFPRAWARWGRRLPRHRPCFVRGRVEVEFGVPTVTVDWVGAVEEDSTA